MKLLYRIDRVAKMLSVSRRSIYRLLEQGELEGHNDSPGKRGLKVIGGSVLRYSKRHGIKVEGFEEEILSPNFGFRRKIISKGIE